MQARTGARIGIDASNIRAGGGLTHLGQILRSAESLDVVVFAGSSTLAALPQRAGYTPVHVPVLDRGLLLRFLWQQFRLQRHLDAHGCDVLFSPGGTLPWRVPVPAVTMSQNLLPFEPGEASRYAPLSGMRLRISVLRRAQIRSMRRAQGLIFLTKYAEKTVAAATGPLSAEVRVIPHGLEGRFRQPPRPPRPRESLSVDHPFRVLCVSIVDVYKHPWNVAEAVASLRRSGIPIELDLVGPAYPPALSRLTRSLDRLDPDRRFLRYRGAVPFSEVHVHYRQADAFVFASSCENLPIILLEAMASGLPIACSDRGPMPEVLENGGFYFDPLKPEAIAAALRSLIDRPEEAAGIARTAHRLATRYSWENCAAETFRFVEEVARSRRRPDRGTGAAG